MIKQRVLGQKLTQFNVSLNETVENWRIGNDQIGLENFIKATQHLEDIIDFFYVEKENNIALKALLPIFKKLYQFLLSRDVIGITDVIEFQLIPFIQKWEKEVVIDVKKS